jgi:hypothetical protein
MWNLLEVTIAEQMLMMEKIGPMDMVAAKQLMILSNRLITNQSIVNKPPVDTVTCKSCGIQITGKKYNFRKEYVPILRQLDSKHNKICPSCYNKCYLVLKFQKHDLNKNIDKPE